MRVLAQFSVEILQHNGKFLRVAVGAVLHVGLEARRRAQAADRGRVEEQGHAVAQRGGLLPAVGDHVVRGDRALIPGLQGDEHGARVGLVAAADQVEAADREDVLHRGVLHEGFLHAAAEPARAPQRGAVGQDQRAIEEPHVLGRHEAAGDRADQPHRTAQHAGEQQQRHDRVLQHQAHAADVESGQRGEGTVERPEEC